MRMPMLCGFMLWSATAFADASPNAISSDSPLDPSHPARMAVVHIPSQGVKINGVFYLASGSGGHPTAILFHGMPGNEQNLDLAQTLRRAGWNVLTLHYRGSWGSPGTYSYHHLVEDGTAALAFVRSGSAVAAYGIDAKHIVLIGHSTGGFVASLTAANSNGVAGLVLISGTDDAGEALTASQDPVKWREWVKQSYADSMESLSGCTPDGLAREVLRQASSWSFAAIAPKLVRMPMLTITADDGYAADTTQLINAIAHHGGDAPPPVHMTTDHAYSDHRIALQTTIVEWLQAHRDVKADSKP